MTLSQWVAPVCGAAGLVMDVTTLLIGYGVLKGTVQALAARISLLETDLGSLGDLNVQVARVETRLEGLVEQFKDLNASIRWMRQPSEPGARP